MVVPFLVEALGELVRASGKLLRQGAYGDPAVVPVEVWDAIDRGRGTSYSHQWQTADPGLARYAMASVQSTAEAREAWAAGYRTYRVDVDRLGPVDGEIECPNTTRGVSCADCGLCNGQRGPATNIMIAPIGKVAG